MEAHGSNEKIGELVRLSQMEYEKDPSQPDLIGWPVADQGGSDFGVLDDMLVDVDTGEVPFASICFSGRCTAVPLELLYLDEGNRRLILPVGQAELADAPEFDEDTEDVQPYVDYWNSIAANWQMPEDED